MHSVTKANGSKIGGSHFSELLFFYKQLCFVDCMMQYLATTFGPLINIHKNNAKCHRKAIVSSVWVTHSGEPKTHELNHKDLQRSKSTMFFNFKTNTNQPSKKINILVIWGPDLSDCFYKRVCGSDEIGEGQKLTFLSQPSQIMGTVALIDEAGVVTNANSYLFTINGL